jgi:hypothetical protein
MFPSSAGDQRQPRDHGLGEAEPDRVGQPPGGGVVEELMGAAGISANQHRFLTCPLDKIDWHNFDSNNIWNIPIADTRTLPQLSCTRARNDAKRTGTPEGCAKLVNLSSALTAHAWCAHRSTAATATPSHQAASWSAPSCAPAANAAT